MKWQNSAFNAQGSRVIIVVVQVGAVKIYAAAAVEAVRKKERGGQNGYETQAHFTLGVRAEKTLGQLWAFFGPQVTNKC